MTVAGARDAKPTLREAQLEMTRQRIVDAALSVFGEKGFVAATMEDVASEAAISRPTIYAHFANKAAILRTAMDRLPKARPLFEALLAADTRAARRESFEALNAWWVKQLSQVWPHVQAAAMVDEEIDGWVSGLVTWPAEQLTDIFAAAGADREVARSRAFMIVCMWTEYGSRVGRLGRDLDPAASVDALTDLYEAALELPNAGGSRRRRRRP